MKEKQVAELSSELGMKQKEISHLIKLNKVLMRQKFDRERQEVCI